MYTDSGPNRRSALRWSRVSNSGGKRIRVNAGKKGATLSARGHRPGCEQGCQSKRRRGSRTTASMRPVRGLRSDSIDRRATSDPPNPAGAARRARCPLRPGRRPESVPQGGSGSSSGGPFRPDETEEDKRLEEIGDDGTHCQGDEIESPRVPHPQEPHRNRMKRRKGHLRPPFPLPEHTAAN